MEDLNSGDPHLVPGRFRPGGPKESSPRREPWVDVGFRDPSPSGATETPSGILRPSEAGSSTRGRPTADAVGYRLPVLRTCRGATVDEWRLSAPGLQGRWLLGTGNFSTTAS